MRAADFFEAARAASSDASRAKSQLEELEQRRLSLGSPSSGAVSGTVADVNGTAASIALVDREASLHRRVEEDYRTLDAACEVIYGSDGDHGIERGLGTAYADVVWHRSCGEETWGEVARSTGLGESTARRYYRVAIDYVDSVGLVGAERSVGV